MMEEKKQTGSSPSGILVEGFGIQEARELKNLLVRFIKDYAGKPVEQSDQEWLKQRFLTEMPEMSDDEAEKLSRETIEGVESYDISLVSLKQSRAEGKTSYEWFADKAHEAAAGLSSAAFGKRISELDTALENANAQMMRTVTTKAGDISRQIYLDGFIAEQHHVNAFNTAVQASGSQFHAEVCVPEAGQAYGRNSFDLVIRDPSGKIVHQYQSKYGVDAEHTIQLIKNGNYNNQTLLVPPEQAEAVQAAFPGKTVVSQIGGTEKVPIQSTPLSKSEVQNMQRMTQETGIMPEMGWGSYDTRMLTKYVGKQAALAGVQGAVIGAGFHLAAKLVADEPIYKTRCPKCGAEFAYDAIFFDREPEEYYHPTRHERMGVNGENVIFRGSKHQCVCEAFDLLNS